MDVDNFKVIFGLLCFKTKDIGVDQNIFYFSSILKLHKSEFL